MSLSRSAGTSGPARRAAVTLAAGVAVALGLGGVAACGAASGQQAADAATANLSNAKVASFTLHLSDPKGSLTASATSAAEKKSLQFIEDSTLTVTIDPAGDTTIGAAAAAPTPSSDPAAALKAAGSMEVDLSHGGTSVVGLRLIDGTLYLRADLSQLSDLSGQQLSDGLAAAPPALAPLVSGVKSGKWLSLDLPALLAKYPELATAMSSSTGTAASPQALLQLRTKLLAAFMDNSTRTVTTSGSETVVHLAVRAKGFLTAVSAAVEASGLPTGSSLASAKAKLSSVPDGTFDATVTVKGDHYTRASVDLHSVAALGTDARAKADTAGVELLADINDRAAALSAPAAGQVVALNSLVESLISELITGTLSLPGLTQG